MVELVYCYFGNGIALGASGAKGDIEVELNRLYNYGGHNDQIEWLSDTFGYVLTTKQKLERGVVNLLRNTDFTIVAAQPRGKVRKDFLDTLAPLSVEEACKFVEEIPLENFLGSSNIRRKEYGFTLDPSLNADSLSA